VLRSLRLTSAAGAAGVALVALLAASAPAAAAPPVVTPNAQGPFAATAGQLGLAVAISGSTAVVGAPLLNDQAGAAYVFTWSHGTWSLQAELTPVTPAQGQQFGGSVAISGSTVVVGAAWEDIAGIGSAYVFVRHGTRWSQQARLAAIGGAYDDGFAVSVAVSGSTAVVGAPYRQSERGAAYVFTRHDGRWSQQAQLRPSPALTDFFGDSVAVSGTTAFVGADEWKSARGTAFVFTRSGTHWSQQAQLIEPGLIANDFFGYAVALAGETAVIGVNGWEIDRGKAVVYTRTGTRWSQQAVLVPSRPQVPDAGFGSAAAVSGSTAVVGTFGSGRAYVFIRSGATWSQQATLARGGANGLFGAAVGVSRGAAVIGEPAAGNWAGAAFAWTTGYGLVALHAG